MPRARFHSRENHGFDDPTHAGRGLAAALTVPAALHSQRARPVDARATVPARSSVPTAALENSARLWYTELQQIQARLQPRTTG